ncbi:SDR family NAD(P)-dependent oxidoreductase [archaeon]|nr:SDR family NAD(P)-dependent oxidoreductase [archaeon]MBL7057155.1 SDR family NAD(P)-dependent oxidoreductase [Candidatus Woesearchaeota archaeon]
MKRVILTGASEGLGFELSKLLLKKDIEVIALCRQKPSCDVVHIETDLSSDESIKEAIEKIKNDYSKFDVLINCADVLSVKPLDKIDSDELENLFKVNVLSQIKLVSGLLSLIKKNESDIVNVGSTVGLKAYTDQCAYGSSKWAVRGTTKNLQLELGKTKCRVIGFNPGGFKSTLFEKATGQKVNLEGFMEPIELAKLMIQILELPKTLEVSEIEINRK